ncbi:MAG: hypothetical protein KatS3mg081_2410 [Gemmatimonadales bacterium]|nr:hypothetical protein HRbin33_01469 [bacterium HR33]GIW53055.1 MAG: hypothetical protein KatS3mg081_2410 [Gemmatimonadales bacterium]
MNDLSEPTQVSEYSRGVALPLAVLLGIFGAHRFYVGRTGSGVLMLCTLGGLGLWWLYDLILIAAGEFRDNRGRRVLRWLPGDTIASYPRTDTPSGKLDQEIESLREEITDLAERVDFLERLLTQLRNRQELPPGGS